MQWGGPMQRTALCRQVCRRARRAGGGRPTARRGCSDRICGGRRLLPRGGLAQRSRDGMGGGASRGDYASEERGELREHRSSRVFRFDTIPPNTVRACGARPLVHRVYTAESCATARRGRRPEPTGRLKTRVGVSWETEGILRTPRHIPSPQDTAF